MTAPIPTFLLPRLMKAAEAAAYLGMSKSKFLDLGFKAKKQDGLRLYDRLDLDAWASELPYDGVEEEENGCDGLFGVSE